MGKYEKVPDPTPQEIAERCLEIQAEWTEAERYKRGCPSIRESMPDQHSRSSEAYEVPVVRLMGIDR